MGNRVYNRQYMESLYQRFRAEKDEVSMELFGGCCYMCGDSESYQHFHLHHYVYHPEDSSYRRTSKAMWTRMLRVEEAKANPERFRLLCPRCHRLITSVGTYLLRRLQPISTEISLNRFKELALLELSNRYDEIESYTI